MSSETKNNNGIWGALGKAGVLVGLIWGGIQIYNYVFKINDFEAETNGRHSSYSTTPILLKGFNANIDHQAIVKTIIDADGALKSYDYKALKKSVHKEYKYMSYGQNYDNLNPFNPYWQGDYSSIWSFKIKNIGSKPLEELALELPFNGYYKINFPDNTTKVDSFSNKINLKELRPSYEIFVTCWTDADSYDLESDEEKSRFTHKNGWFSISYPVEADGLYAWNIRNRGNPLLFFCALVIFLFIIVYASGEAAGKRKQKSEQENIQENKESENP